MTLSSWEMLAPLGKSPILQFVLMDTLSFMDEGGGT